MTERGKVKVIKKGQAQVPAAKAAPIKTARIAAREMVSNVSDWVTDFKTRKSVETKAAIEILFSAQARPNES